MPIDPVTLQILANHAQAAAESMAFTLFRTAHSTFVKETEDFTTGLTTPDGQTFASPRELGATWFVGLDYGPVIRAIDDYREGDVCMTNDPYSGFVCTHPPDLHLWKPIFWEGELVCFAVGHIHNTDVGGAVPASLSRALTEVHQEGIRFPPCKLVSEGRLDRRLLDIMLLNVRAPTQNWGDLKAQLASVNTGERKVHEMIRRFGIETFRQGIRDLLDLGERQARRVLASIPDGDYPFTDYLDEDAPGGLPCRLHLNLKIRGEEAVMDFTGSDPQLAASLNMPTGNNPRHILLMVGWNYALYTLDSSVLLNGGLMRPCTCIVPEGTVLNPVFPAAVGMRSMTCARLQGVIMGAFQRAVPDRLPAGPASGGPMMNVNTIDSRTGRRVMAAIDPITGGAGGSPFGDGMDGSGANNGFLKNTPVEINEAEVPIRILRYGLEPDSGGAGLHRGGLATVLEFRVQAPGTVVTARNRDRTRFRSWGVQGGKPGAPSQFWRNPDTDRAENLGNTDVVTLDPGDVIRIVCSGGSGWGPAWQRPVEAVLADLAAGKITAEAAMRDYGVVPGDAAATAAGRGARAAPPARGLDARAERDAYERVWTEANYAALTEILALLPVHWRHYAKRRIFALVEADPDRRGDGSEVRAAFAALQAEFPQIAH
ncbi:hydantoinase B/oxoprolinase family protein [Elioraea sp. Yellowstone]|uniref:hydantoinase B/oxoprolinase family protein n=1 Tax=Elioraea sp. Yellowstone TaxID=2592070 RepID=UPI00114D87E2|nr:hydantoinase B/oxoprolinase family protein [Elioraea sp. Yellowstone]TQF78557.1 hydantoinase B/oxoprolinase family protein [Elioraea sp. Yellowstone]